ncbi:MAG TPA: ferric reductase [Deinococcales bacterium]|nr:ferric reductase [Deinococcales bacterium]
MTTPSLRQPVKDTDRQENFNETLTALVLAALALTWFLALRGLTPGPLAWVVLRVTGIVSYAALAVATSLGALIASRLAPAWLNRAVQYGWHGLLAGFALSAGAVHGLFLAVDSRFAQPVWRLLVPGATTFNPVWVGLGTAGLYALALVFASTALKGRLSRKAWKTLHLFSYPAFAALTLHGLMSGSDHLTGLYVVSTLAVAVTFTARITEELARRGTAEA